MMNVKPVYLLNIPELCDFQELPVSYGIDGPVIQASYFTGKFHARRMPLRFSPKGFELKKKERAGFIDRLLFGYFQN